MKVARALKDYILEGIRKDYVAAVLVPANNQIAQVAQVFLLAFGKPKTWVSVSIYEVVRRQLDDESNLDDVYNSELLILTYGFDTVDNKLIPQHAQQILMSRSSRKLPTLLVLKSKDPLFKYPQRSVPAGSTQSSPRALDIL